MMTTARDNDAGGNGGPRRRPAMPDLFDADAEVPEILKHFGVRIDVLKQRRPPEEGEGDDGAATAPSGDGGGVAGAEEDADLYARQAARARARGDEASARIFDKQARQRRMKKKKKKRRAGP